MLPMIFGVVIAAIGIFGAAIAFAVVVTFPLWFIWTYLGYGVKYFYWLPGVFQAPGFWNVLGLMVLISILRGLFLGSVSNK